MDHLNEDEQVEAIKNWWKANGGAIIAGIVIGLTAIFGWRYWNAYQDGLAEEASRRYDAAAAAFAGADALKAREHGQTLLEDFPDTPYAALAALLLARLAMDEGDTGKAVEHLRWVIEQAEQAEMKTIARLRLARVLLAENRLDEAEAELRQVADPAFAGEREELLGDLYAARGEPDKARQAYETASAASGAGPMLQLKIDNLPPAGAASEPGGSRS